MIEFLVILVFSWIFARKLWKHFFKRIGQIFKNVLGVFMLPFKRQNASIALNLGKSILKLVKMVFRAIFWLVHWLIKGIYELLDYLKMKIWN